jgi:hypothetical protein
VCAGVRECPLTDQLSERECFTDTVGGTSSSGLIHRREPNFEETSSGADRSVGWLRRR